MRFESEVVKREPAKEEGFKKEEDVEVGAGARGPEVEEVEEEGETQALDRLCLALALLTNVVQIVEETKDLLREIRASHLIYVLCQKLTWVGRTTSFM